MAKKSMILKQQAPAKFSTRKYNRCKLCGRPHAYLRDYGVCRICFRTLAYKGVSARLPGNLFPPYFVGSAQRTQSTPSPRRLVWRKNPGSISCGAGMACCAQSTAVPCRLV